MDHPAIAWGLLGLLLVLLITFVVVTAPKEETTLYNPLGRPYDPQDTSGWD